MKIKNKNNKYDIYRYFLQFSNIILIFHIVKVNNLLYIMIFLTILSKFYDISHDVLE